MSRRWIIVALLCAGTVISYLARQKLSVVAPQLRDELGLSNFGYARVVFAFLLGYTLAQGAAGWLMDRLGPRRGFAAIMAWWSAVASLHAFGSGIVSFSILRFLLGVGQAGSWAASVRAVADWFPPRERGFPNGTWAAGTSIGTIVAVPLVASLTVAIGWRAAFLATGMVGFVWLIAWLTWYPGSPVDGRAARSPAVKPGVGPDSVDGDSFSGSYGELLRNRNVWALILSRLFADPVAWFYNVWVPEYLVRSAGFSMSDIGRYAWIPFFVNGVGILIGGMASDALCRRAWGVIPARMAVMLTGVLLMTFGVIAAFSVSVSVAIAVISVAVFGFGLWAPNMMSLGADAFPRHAASVTGLSGMGAGLGGMVYTLMTGWLLDRVGYGPVFIATGMAPVVAFAVLYGLFEMPRARRAPQA
jgi:MFS transporter, ACS family, hexuronate transporter